MITIQIWRNRKLESDFDYDPEINQMETIETFVDWLGALEKTGEPGDGFTIIAHKFQ